MWKFKFTWKYYRFCPYNKEHIIRKRLFESHILKCPNKTERRKEEKNEENINIIKNCNSLIAYNKKIYKKGNEIIEKLEKNEYNLFEKEKNKIENKENIREKKKKLMKMKMKL